MIMCIIGKLREEKKANWPSHLAEIVHAYNATQSAVTVGNNEVPTRETSTRSVDMYIASVRDTLRSTLWEAQAQSTTEACRQKWHL